MSTVARLGRIGLAGCPLDAGTGATPSGGPWTSARAALPAGGSCRGVAQGDHGRLLLVSRGGGESRGPEEPA